MIKEKVQHNFFFVMVAVVTAAGLFLMSPYADVFFVALMFAIIFKPIDKGLRWLFRGRKAISALVATAIITIVVLAPLSFFGYQIVKEAQGIYGTITSNGGIAAVVSTSGVLQRYMPGVAADTSGYINRYTEQGLQWVIARLGVVFSSVAATAINFTLVLFTLFFLFKDEDAFRAGIMAMSPLEDAHNKELLNKIERAIASVVKGTLLVALMQGGLTGIGFVLTGVPNPVLWGSVAVVAAIIPAIGTSLVVVPAILYLILAGHMFAAGFLLVWGLGVVGTADNIVRPLLIERGVKIHPLLIMFSALGGVQLMGVVGFFVGPVVLAILSALYDMYPKIIAHHELKPE